MTVEKIICANCEEKRSKYCGEVCERCYKTIRMINSPMIKCACKPECQEMIYSVTFDNEPRTMKKGHEMMGENHHNYQGGVRTDKDGYKYILSPNHPYKDSMGYVPHHRLMMEHYYSIIFDEEIYLPYPKFEINHINGKVDYNCLMNLELVTHKEHRGIHGSVHKGKHLPQIKLEDRICLLCNSKTTWINNQGKPKWYLHEHRGFICKNCYKKIKRK